MTEWAQPPRDVLQVGALSFTFNFGQVCRKKKITNHSLKYGCPLARGCSAGQAPGISLSGEQPGLCPSGSPMPLPWLAGFHSKLLSCLLAGYDQVVIFLHDPFPIFLYKKGNQLYRVAIGIKVVIYKKALYRLKCYINGRYAIT